MVKETKPLEEHRKVDMENAFDEFMKQVEEDHARGLLTDTFYEYIKETHDLVSM